MLSLPIPTFNPKNKVHKELAKLGAKAERAAQALELNDDVYFTTARKRIRQHLRSHGVMDDIDAHVEMLLGSA